MGNPSDSMNTPKKPDPKENDTDFNKRKNEGQPGSSPSKE